MNTEKKGIVALITLLYVVTMFSIDMYLPALPHMGASLGASDSLINLTLAGYCLFFSAGVLVFGPLSDRWGRKPLLAAGTLTFILASVLCALAPSVWVLIVCRVFQALGAGCLVAIPTAMIKDCFGAHERTFVLTLTQSISVVGPMVAPFLGSITLMATSWRGIFWLLAALGTLCLVPLVFLKEPLPKEARSSETLVGSLGRLFVLGRNPGFLSLLLIISVLTAPYMAYLAVVSYVYIGHFHLSNTLYSCFFAANAFLSVVAPFLYLKWGTRASARGVMALTLGASAASGGFLFVWGGWSPLAFLLAFAPFVLAEGIVRPFSMVVLLDQNEGDSGSASSLINFVFSVVSSLVMVLAGLGWESFITGLGTLTLGCTTLATLGWWGLLKSKVLVKGVNR